MLTSDELANLRDAIPGDPDLTGLLQTLRARAAPLLAGAPMIPAVKALLSRDGGFCPNDGTSLGFDPWNPDRHRCPRCGQVFAGERHHRNWARAQHLWLAERSAELALIAAVSDDQTPADRAAELLGAYDQLYFALPNRDNVLGPSHLFFSTYLESLWITSYLAAACLLREAGRLADARVEGINRVAEEAAALIGDFNEGHSNRQTWHAAALAAIAVWFDDLDLARTAVESRTGLLGHLADGFGDDGLWWEGENYHLFALRGLMQGIHWARAMGFDLLEDPELRGHFRSALLGPTRSALPDFTYPARRDSRYGVSLAQPAALELWEIGRAWLGGDAELDAWLGALYSLADPLPPAEHYDAWLHDAGRPAPPRYSRRELSWWALTALQPAPATAPEWRPASVLLGSQGLAVLRHDRRYASLECGRDIGGHGHPDRLHLTLHAGGIPWLPDPGTGSYVQPSLAWYRSALAHNAPLLDGENPGGEDAWCEAFAAEAEWAWCRGRAGEARRTLVLSPHHLVDLVEVEPAEDREVVLPWHFQGELEFEPGWQWQTASFEHPFVSQAEHLVAAPDTKPQFTLRHPVSGAILRAHFLAPGAELLRAIAPGLPVEPEPRAFLLLRTRGARVRWVSLLDWAPPGSGHAVTRIETPGDEIEVTTTVAVIRYQITNGGLKIVANGQSRSLAGLLPAPRHRPPVFADPGDADFVALAPRLAAAPALDGTLQGFDLSAPLLLDSEHQYRRSEEPYDPERFSARAWINWDGESLYLAAAVSKPDLLFRAPDEAALLLDNEPDDIHSDGIQLYWRVEQETRGFLIVPGEEGGVHPRPAGGFQPGEATVTGRWQQSEDGYLVTLRLDDPAITHLGPGVRLGFDLLINEMQPERLRRAGQLVWSGGGGWIYLRGDRQEAARLGVLELS